MEATYVSMLRKRKCPVIDSQVPHISLSSAEALVTLALYREAGTPEVEEAVTLCSMLVRQDEVMVVTAHSLGNIYKLWKKRQEKLEKTLAVVFVVEQPEV